MRSLRFSAVYGGSTSSLVLLMRPHTSTQRRELQRISAASSLVGFCGKLSHTTSDVALTCSSRRCATTCASTPLTAAAEDAAAPIVARLSRASEAMTELQRWIASLHNADSPSSPSSSSSSPALVLSGKSLVLCVTALRLQASQVPASTIGIAADTPEVQQYLTALAQHVYTQYNAAGKPRAPWQLMEDVNKGVVRAEALRSSVQFLQHQAFGCLPRQEHILNNKDKSDLNTVHDDAEEAAYNATCAARDLELTFEAVEALLSGRQISEIHRSAAASMEVGSASTTAAMVPPAEAAAFYISTVVRLTRAPLTSAPDQPTKDAAAFQMLPQAKQHAWMQEAQQLTTVLYLALLVTNANSTDAQLVSHVFRETVRRAYGNPSNRFGVMRSMHYLLTVALPYVMRSFSTILDVVRAQQAEAARQATAAAKANVPRTQQHQQQRGDATATTVTPPTQKAAAGKAQGSTKRGGSGGGGTASGLSSDRMNKLTLVAVCIACALYVATSGTGGTQPAVDLEAAPREKELKQTHQRLSAMAASATAPKKE